MEGKTFLKDVHLGDREEIAPNTKNYAPFQKTMILKSFWVRTKEKENLVWRPKECFSLCYSLVTQTVKNLLAVQEAWIRSWVGKIPWRREWQPTPVFFPGESHGQRSPMGYSPQGQRVRHDWATKHTHTGSTFQVVGSICISYRTCEAGLIFSISR